MAKPILGVQLYTVREALAADFVGTVTKVRQAGYDAVELCGKGPMANAELKKFMDGLGLRAAGVHVPLNELENNLEDWLRFVEEVKVANMVLPFLPAERRKTREDWVALAGVLDQVGAKCRKRGVKFAYHNHSFEFVQFEGKYALDILYENCSPENVFCELDTYWIKHGGADPVTYIKKYGKRCVILHVKDMADDEAKSFTEVGRGILDWSGIHKAAQAAGIPWYCVEQDRCPGDPFDSIRISAEFIRKRLGVQPIPKA